MKMNWLLALKVHSFSVNISTSSQIGWVSLWCNLGHHSDKFPSPEGTHSILKD